jgi:hypothetical protein
MDTPANPPRLVAGCACGDGFLLFALATDKWQTLSAGEYGVCSR